MSENANPGPELSAPRGTKRPVPSLAGGLILILLGVLFLLSEMDKIGWSDWWAYFLVGLGAILIIDALFRATSAEGRKGVWGKVVAGLILAAIGGAHLVGFEEWWPLIFIALGVGVLVSGFTKRK